MSRPVWIAGGTTEGRELALYASSLGIPTYVTVATAYGASLLPPQPSLTVLARPMDQQRMEKFLQEVHPSLVIDATHPYAVDVTQCLQQACADQAVPYSRVVRPSQGDREGAVFVHSFAEAVELLSQTEGNIFLTTGSHHLEDFTHVPDYAKRLYIRILPFGRSLTQALELGYAPSHIICMQGPFSEALNAAMFQQVQAACVVTKDSGKAGGFPEKAAAAKEAGAMLLVIQRPQEQGVSLDAMKGRIAAMAKEE